MKYPYIGQGNHSGAVFLFIGEGVTLTMQRGDSLYSGYETHISEGLCTNITHEYLQNTYGEVQSPEHAEFIVELAKANDIEVCASFRDGLFFNFYSNKDSGKLVLFFFREDKAKEDGEKQITIPLPPKTEPLKNAGDNLVLGCEDSKCDEWPCINDTVVTRGGSKGVVKISKPDNDGMIVCDFDGEYALTYKNELQKPKTPEEELRDEIKQEVFSSFAIMPEPLAKRDVAISISECIANELTRKYKITPQ